MINLKRISALTAIFLIPFVLSSCFFPEEFESEVEIRKNGTFRFSYDGTLIFVPGRADDIADKEIRELEHDLKKDKGFKEIEYMGHSKFKVIYEKEGSLDTPFYFVGRRLDLFAIYPKGGGLIEVRGVDLNERQIRELEELKLSIDGELTVKTDGKVIEHNANSTPSLFGLVGGYGWEIKSLHEPQPRILISIE